MIRALLQFSFLVSQAQATAPSLSIEAKNSTATVASGASTKDEALDLTITLSALTENSLKIGDLDIANGELESFKKVGDATTSLKYTAKLKSTKADKATVVSIKADVLEEAGSGDDKNAVDANLFTWTKTSKGVMTGVTCALAFLVAFASIQ